jgi:hypothetical protein
MRLLSVSEGRRRRMKNNIVVAIIVRHAKAPITPPAIAPMLLEELELGAETEELFDDDESRVMGDDGLFGDVGDDVVLELEAETEGLFDDEESLALDDELPRDVELLPDSGDKLLKSGMAARFENDGMYVI